MTRCSLIHCRRRRPFARAFTLIEMLIVLAILALLLTLSLPKYFQGVDASKEAVLKENLRLMRSSIVKFYGDTGRYPDTLDELVQRRYLAAMPIDPVTESSETWQLVPPESEAGKVYDVKSGASGATRSGIPFGQL